MSDKIVTLRGEKLRTVDDVIAELQKMHDSGDLKSLLVVRHDGRGDFSVDWSYMPMQEFIYASTAVQHNAMKAMDGAFIHG